jgi:hypothetical protein
LLAAVLLPVAPAAASAASGLVLGALETPGLEQAGAPLEAARKALAAVLRPAPLPALPAKGIATSRFVASGDELWSVAYVFASSAIARRGLGLLAAAASKARLHPSHVRVGNGGVVFGGPGRTTAVVWQDSRALGVILLRASLPAAAARGLAIRYAGVAESGMHQDLAETLWQRTLAQVNPDGTVPRATRSGSSPSPTARCPGCEREGRGGIRHG